MAKTLDSLGNFDEGSELRGPQNLAVNHIANAVLGKERLPDIRLQLLHAQGQAAIFRLNTQNHSLDLLALLQHFRRMLDALGPAQVRDMHQAVDAVLDLDEGAKVGEVANAAFDNRSRRITLRQI